MRLINWIPENEYQKQYKKDNAEYFRNYMRGYQRKRRETKKLAKLEKARKELWTTTTLYYKELYGQRTI